MALLLAASVGSRVAHAGQDDYRWCFDPDGGGATPGCCDNVDNGTPFTTIQEVMAAVEGAEGPSAGQAPAFQAVCVAAESAVTFDIDIDFASLSGGLIQFEWSDQSIPNWCPDQNGVEVAGATTAGVYELLSLQGVHLDAASCGSMPDPLVEVTDADFEFNDARILGALPQGVAFSTSSGAELAQVGIRTTRFEGLQGPVAVGTGVLRFDRAEVSASESFGEPLINAVDERSQVNATASLFYGNAVHDGHPLMRVGGRLVFDYASFVANEVEQDASLVLLDIDPTKGDPIADIQFSTFSDNRLRSGDGATASDPVPRPFGADPQATLCLPKASDGIAPRGRQRPEAPQTAGSGALLDVVGSNISTTYMLLVKSYFVGNTVGPSGAVLRLGENGPARAIQFIHNTCDVADGFVIEATTSTPIDHLVSARNLLLGAPSVSLGDWEFADTTMEYCEGDPTSWSTGFASSTGIVGPFPDAFASGGGDLLLGTDGESRLPAALRLHGARVCLAPGAPRALGCRHRARDHGRPRTFCPPCLVEPQTTRAHR